MRLLISSAFNYFISCCLVLSFVANFQSLYAYGDKVIDPKIGAEISVATLRFAFIIATHGSRAPLYTYPNDPFPYNDTRFWPKGKGQLTNGGRNQLYNVGSKLRERYEGFITLNFHPNDTFAVYNPVDRNFESISYLLASLYPPIEGEVWSQNLRWQPIPSSKYHFNVCELLKNGKCPVFAKEAVELVEQYGAKEGIKTTAMMKYVSKHTNETLKSVIQLLDITDTLSMQEESGFRTPEWAMSVYPKDLREIEVNLMNALFGGSDRVVSLTAGPELKHIAELFNKKVNGILAENSKMYIELGQDCIMYSLLKAMGSKFGLEKIETGAHLIFELHQIYSSYIVQVFFFMRPGDDKPKEINITDCLSPCSIENFNLFVNKTIGPKAWDSACKL